VDFDLGGVVGVRLLGAAPADLSSARQVLGTPVRRLDREPDIAVHVSGGWEPRSPSWVEPGRSGFAAEGFFALKLGRHHTRTRLSLDGACDRWELSCASVAAALPLLLPLVRLASLRNGAVALHAAAFVVDGRGVIASAWPHGGKTTALLAFMERGGRYVADDWVLLSGDGARMVAVPGPVTISDAHARSPLVSRHSRGAADLRRRAAGWAGRTLPALLPARGREGAFGKATGRLAGALARRAERRFDPAELFGETLREAPPAVLFLLMRHESPDVRIEPMETAPAATRLACASVHEDLPFLSLCHGYQFAFPGSDGVRFFTRDAQALREQRLHEALAPLRAFLVRHPRGVDPAVLHAAMAPLIEATP